MLAGWRHAGGVFAIQRRPILGAEEKKMQIQTDQEVINRYTLRNLDVVLKKTDREIMKLTNWILMNLTIAKISFGIAQEDPLGDTPMECWSKMQQGNRKRSKDLRMGFSILCNQLRRRAMLRKRLREAQVEKEHRDVRNGEMEQLARVKRWILKGVM